MDTDCVILPQSGDGLGRLLLKLQFVLSLKIFQRIDLPSLQETTCERNTGLYYDLFYTAFVKLQNVTAVVQKIIFEVRN